MISWIMGNIGTIIITFFLILIVAGIITSMIKDKKRGISSCGGNCAKCMEARRERMEMQGGISVPTCRACAACRRAEKHAG